MVRLVIWMSMYLRRSGSRTRLRFIASGVNEAAFELHARLPHTVQFLEAAKRLLTNGVNGLRTREIGADIGASAAE